jgi:deoxyribodipyrimidine photolyase
MSRRIWWIRRDLRLADNTVLVAALTNATEVIPVFALDSYLLRTCPGHDTGLSLAGIAAMPSSHDGH